MKLVYRIAVWSSCFCKNHKCQSCNEKEGTASRPHPIWSAKTGAWAKQRDVLLELTVFLGSQNRSCLGTHSGSVTGEHEVAVLPMSLLSVIICLFFWLGETTCGATCGEINMLTVPRLSQAAGVYFSQRGALTCRSLPPPPAPLQRRTSHSGRPNHQVVPKGSVGGGHSWIGLASRASESKAAMNMEKDDPKELVLSKFRPVDVIAGRRLALPLGDFVLRICYWMGAGE